MEEPKKTKEKGHTKYSGMKDGGREVRVRESGDLHLHLHLGTPQQASPSRPGTFLCQRRVAEGGGGPRRRRESSRLLRDLPPIRPVPAGSSLGPPGADAVEPAAVEQSPPARAGAPSLGLRAVGVVSRPESDSVIFFKRE